MATHLVTGGAGFLGSHVARHLLESGNSVVVLDDLSGGFRRNVPDGCEFVEGSIVDQDLVAHLFREHRFEQVFHFAAYAAEVLSHHVRRFNYTNNLVGSATLINEAIRHGTRCFVFASSVAVYGDAPAPCSETDAATPIDPYGIAKLSVEHDLRCAQSRFGLDHVIFRPHNVYGEGQNLRDPHRNVVGIFMAQALRGEACTVFGDGSQRRCFTHIDDVAPIIARSVDDPAAINRTFNIGSDDSCSVAELATLVQAALGLDVGIRHLPARHECHDVRADHAEIRSRLGVRPTVDLNEGIRRMAAWARTLPLPPPRPFGGVELDHGLPGGWSRSEDRQKQDERA